MTKIEDVERCGAVHPKKPTEVCARNAGHVGMHMNRGNLTWKDKKPPPALEPALTDACPKCGLELGEHDGKKCPKPEKGVNKDRLEHVFGLISQAVNGITADDLARIHRPALRELERAGRIEYRGERWHPVSAEQRRKIAERDAVFFGKDALEKNGITVGPAPSRKRHVDKEVSVRVHPAADALPMIEGAEFDALVDDIRVNGLRHRPVLDHTGEWLVDGRNRKRACDLIGIAVEYERLPEDTNIAAFVISTNLKRRHLTEGQRAAIASEIANLSQGQRKQTRPGAGLEKDITQAEAAAGAGVGERTVQRANAVHDKAVPELWEAVKKGKVDLRGAEQVAKLSPKKQRELVKERIEPAKGPVRGGKLAALARQEEKRAVVRKINEQKVPPAPVGPFRLIVADFPWPYENSDQHEGSRGHIPYPPMPVEDGIRLASELDKLAHEDGCILAFWTTNAFMPEAVRMVEAWGFSWRTIFTWDKERDGIGTWGRGRTEHMIIAERGEVTHTLNEVSTLLRAPRREHSRKPDEMMALLEQHCPGPWLEMFARERRNEKWAVWGAEVNKFATEAA